MENIALLFDTPQKTAAQLTSNPFLQDFIETLLSLKNHEERRVFENGFWVRVQQFPATEQAVIRVFYLQIVEKLKNFKEQNILTHTQSNYYLKAA